jgi:hypothetical protein
MAWPRRERVCERQGGGVGGIVKARSGASDAASGFHNTARGYIASVEFHRAMLHTRAPMHAVTATSDVNV